MLKGDELVDTWNSKRPFRLRRLLVGTRPATFRRPHTATLLARADRRADASDVPLTRLRRVPGASASDVVAAGVTFLVRPSPLLLRAAKLIRP